MIITAENGFDKNHAAALKKLAIDHSIECIVPNADLHFYLQRTAKFYHLTGRNKIRDHLLTMKKMILHFAQQKHPNFEELKNINSDKFRLNSELWFNFQRQTGLTKRIRPAFFFASSGHLRRFAKNKIGLIAGKPDDIFILRDHCEELIVSNYRGIIETMNLKGINA